jgi:hypothetical protein
MMVITSRGISVGRQIRSKIAIEGITQEDILEELGEEQNGKKPDSNSDIIRINRFRKVWNWIVARLHRKH